jgi:hypothetical protein
MTTYELENDPRIASVLRLVTADRYAEALETPVPFLWHQVERRRQHQDKILGPASLLSVVDPAVDRESGR